MAFPLMFSGDDMTGQNSHKIKRKCKQKSKTPLLLLAHGPKSGQDKGIRITKKIRMSMKKIGNER